MQTSPALAAVRQFADGLPDVDPLFPAAHYGHDLYPVPNPVQWSQNPARFKPRPDFIPCADCEMKGSCTSVRHCAGPRDIGAVVQAAIDQPPVPDALALAKSRVIELQDLCIQIVDVLEPAAAGCTECSGTGFVRRSDDFPPSCSACRPITSALVLARGGL